MLIIQKISTACMGVVQNIPQRRFPREVTQDINPKARIHICPALSSPVQSCPALSFHFASCPI